MIEIMISLSIALFLMTGLFGLFLSTKQNSVAQSALSQLQDDQRMAMSLLATIIQQAGYFPNPQALTVATALPVDATFLGEGQSVFGTDGAPQQISIRFVAAKAELPPLRPAEFPMDCNGGFNKSGADLTYVNTFAIVSNELTCKVSADAAQSLVAGISALSAQYGVDPDATGSVSQYLNPEQMTTALWQSVRSVRVTLTFLNPLAGQPGQLPIEFSRVINVQSRT